MPAPHILVVDDDRDTRELYRVLFEASGFRVSEAESVADGVASCALDEPDVVLTDWRLTDGNAFALCEALHDHAPDVPIVAATGMSLPPEDIARARSLGCIEVLTKPVDLDVLLASVSRAVSAST